jgi:hypothetical protein
MVHQSVTQLMPQGHQANHGNHFRTFWRTFGSKFLCFGGNTCPKLRIMVLRAETLLDMFWVLADTLQNHVLPNSQGNGATSLHCQAVARLFSNYWYFGSMGRTDRHLKWNRALHPGARKLAQVQELENNVE